MTMDKHTIFIDIGDARIILLITAQCEEGQDEDGWHTYSRFDPDNEYTIDACIDACGDMLADFVEIQRADNPEIVDVYSVDGHYLRRAEDALVFDIWDFDGPECFEGPEDEEIESYLRSKGF